MAHKNSFKISEAISYGWTTFKKNWQFLAIVTVIYVLVSLIPDWISSSLKDQLPGAKHVVDVIGWIALWIVEIGGIVIALKIVDHKVPKLEDLYKHYPLLLNYFLVNLFMGFIVILGLIFLIVPGIYFAMKYYFAVNLVIDKKMGPIEAMKASSKMTEGIKWRLLGLGLVSLGIIILGLLALGVGFIVALPVVVLADVHVYRKISSHHAE